MSTRSISLLAFLLLPAMAWASTDNGWKSPSATICGADWSNCDSTYASDNKRASHTATSSGDMILTGFSQGVPAGATIDTIIVSVEGYGDYVNNCTRRNLYLTLTKDGGSAAGETNTLCLDATTESTVEQRGTLTPLWNTSWSASAINSSDFGILIVNSGSKADGVYVDHLQIKIWYTEVAAGKAQVMRTVISD